jgi:cell division protein ZapE
MDLPQEAGAGNRLRERYRDLLAAGTLRADPAQAEVVARLAELADALAAYPPAAPRAGWLDRLRGRSARRLAPPRGLYLHGPVGRGKSLLMDLFFETAPVAARRRVHFHAFMLEVHARLDRQRKAAGDGADPLAPLADALLDEAWLLCFDEFHVQNIADAMILGRLFEALLARGMVVVATSNFAPERLYEDGLNRDRFLPFIALLRERLRVLELVGATDYRLERLRDVPVWQQPLGAEAEARLEQIFQALTDGAAGAPATLAVGSRRLTVPRAARGVAWFDFEALCEQPLGAADYLALTERFHTVLLSGVPQLTPDKRNQARRFITLVDALYDRRINLVASAAAAPEALYPAGDGAFEFQRTVSRLNEMRSRDYVESAPLTGAAAHAFTPFALTTDVI